MYTTVQSPRRWNAVAPWICILLVSLLLFAIAATIVISLIALYVPTKNVIAQSTSSGSQQLSIPLSSDSTQTTGTLDAATQTSLQNQLQTSLSSNSETANKAAVQVNSGTAADTGKRKRRQSGQRATVVVVIFELIFTQRCTWKKCRKRVLELAFLLFVNLSPKLTGIGSNPSNPSGSSTSNPSQSTTSSKQSSSDTTIVSDLDLIMPYWANLRPYEDNPPNVFGVQDVGLPDGCQVEQVFALHRHAARFPSSADTIDINEVTTKLKNTTGKYTGPLTFFNTWTNKLGSDQLLPIGAHMEYQSGVDFWDKFGRILYDTSKGQNYYNATGQTKPKLRCNNIQRVNDSAHAWADGFFTLYNQSTKYDLTVIPADSGRNNTLSSFVSCKNFLNTSLGIFDIAHTLYHPLEHFGEDTVARISQYVPSDVKLEVFDTFIMQTLCAFESVFIGTSDFCNLFTLTEWKRFRYTYDLFVYNGFSFGSPFGRAIGLGVVQELIARLNNQLITVSTSSVNTTFDGNPDTFPLGQKFYLDMTHDFIITGMLTALNIDYFKEDLPSDSFDPTPEDRHVKANLMIPYAARLITEKIGCNLANPTAVSTARTQYSPTQYGYSAASATNKFIRMRLNSGIVPLATIRGGLCAGRTDGLCSLNNFLASQANITAEANYPLCFATFNYNASRFKNDGNYFL